MPLYTIWQDGTPWTVATAVLHCTLGDIAIGAGALALSLVVLGQGDWMAWRADVAAVSVGFAVAYTVFSEWMNVAIRETWAYMPSMPRLPIGGFEVGLTPVLQWIIVPPLALYLAGRR